MLGRLQLQAVNALLNELEEQGLSGESLRLAFINEMSRSIRAHSIYAHEGRHAIDANLGNFDTPTLEFRAKLSDRPRRVKHRPI